ncbi:MAG TPA: hypothetical protein VGB22_10735 [candidate division Zixibacteria bacterium]|jgi:hypothetical protein
MRHRIVLALGAMVCLAIAAGSAGAAVPQLVNYQGIVLDSTGVPVPDGVYSMRFFIYDDEIAGSVLWAELNPAVQVTGGTFNVLLGSIEPLHDTVFSGTNRWLQVLFVSQLLTPRTQLVSTPFSHRISTVDGASGGDITGDVTITSSSIGNTFEVVNTGGGRGGRFEVSAGSTEPAVLGVSMGAVAGQFFNDGGGDGLISASTGAGYGVDASSSFGTAIRGAAGTSGYGLYGSSSTGTGVYGSSGSTSSNAKAVHGHLTTTSPGSYAAAVRGENAGTGLNGVGVWGSHEGGGWGVYGTSQNILGRGVYGLSSAGIGVFGESSTGAGVYGFSETSYGVWGNSNSTHAVFGTTGLSGAAGIYGRNTSSGSNAQAIRGVLDNTSAGSFSAAVRGENKGTGLTGIGVYGSHAGSGWGVYGEANGGAFSRGVYGASDDGVGLYGHSDNNLSGYFTGSRVEIIGGSDASIGGFASGYLVLGQSNAANIVLDNNEIIARDNGVSAMLHLQADGGQVGIGASGISFSSNYILGVDGRALFEEVEVQLSGSWPDYVFDEDYELMPLDQVERHIKDRKHLPGLPSASEIEEGTLPLGEMQTKLLEKIEELTLHVIALNKQLESAAGDNAQLRERVATLESANTEID